jgi:hypothetical protein
MLVQHPHYISAGLVPVLYAELARRSTGLGWGRSGGVGGVGVDLGVELGVVVHLQLEVELEAAAASEDVGPESVEAGGEIVALGVEEGEAVEIAGAMGFGGGGAAALVGGVVELERENGEAI